MTGMKGMKALSITFSCFSLREGLYETTLHTLHNLHLTGILGDGLGFWR